MVLLLLLLLGIGEELASEFEEKIAVLALQFEELETGWMLQMELGK